MSRNDDDVRRLHALGYGQELARRLGGFSNFALSLSIICILAGGVTSFHLGLCSVGGASIGLGWPLVGLFAWRLRPRWDSSPRHFQPLEDCITGRRSSAVVAGAGPPPGSTWRG